MFYFIFINPLVAIPVTIVYELYETRNGPALPTIISSKPADIITLDYGLCKISGVEMRAPKKSKQLKNKAERT